MSIIHGFRNSGHLLSTTNPIRQRRDRRPHLDLADYHLSEADLGKVFQAGMEIGMPDSTLDAILQHLRLIYCGDIGFEFAHIENREKRMWLKERIEKRPGLGVTDDYGPVSYTHLRAHETPEHLVCRLLLEKKKNKIKQRMAMDYN